MLPFSRITVALTHRRLVQRGALTCAFLLTLGNGHVRDLSSLYDVARTHGPHNFLKMCCGAGTTVRFRTCSCGMLCTISPDDPRHTDVHCTERGSESLEETLWQVKRGDNETLWSTLSHETHRKGGWGRQCNSTVFTVMFLISSRLKPILGGKYRCRAH